MKKTILGLILGLFWYAGANMFGLWGLIVLLTIAEVFLLIKLFREGETFWLLIIAAVAFTGLSALNGNLPFDDFLYVAEQGHGYSKEIINSSIAWYVLYGIIAARTVYQIILKNKN